MFNKISQTRDKCVMVRQVGRWKLWNILARGQNRVKVVNCSLSFSSLFFFLLCYKPFSQLMSVSYN